MKKDSAKPALPLKVSPTDDGLHVTDSILWLDSRANGELSFLSSASQSFATEVPQVIATEETIKILETKNKKQNALICQYNRPFSIGKLKMELLPSGTVLGGASLYVESDKGRILYAPHLQTQKIATVRQMQLKKAHTLIIGAFHADPATALPNRKKERERLIKTIRKFTEEGQYPVILCQPIATAQEITKLLTDEAIPVAVHNTIFKINRVYEDYGSQLGHYTLYSPKYTHDKTLVFPMPNKASGKLRTTLPSGPVLYIEESLSETSDPNAFRQVDDRFYLSTTCDGKELREVIAAVAPKEVYFFGPYAKRFSEELKNTCKTVRPLYSNDQPTLF